MGEGQQKDRYSAIYLGILANHIVGRRLYMAIRSVTWQSVKKGAVGLYFMEYDDKM